MSVIPYGRHAITDADKEAVMAVLDSDFLTQGPLVEKFEGLFAAYVGAPHAVAVTNGTAALHLAARVLNVGPGDKVLVTSNTFVASANCIRYCGGEVEFIDIDPFTYCMDFDLLDKKLSAAAIGTYKGVVVVDFAGYPIDGERLRKIADKHKIWVIEDACHAVGAERKVSNGQWVRAGSGAYADLTVFSFHPVKHLATGEGGMITTANAELGERLRLLRTHGIVRASDKLKGNDGGWYYEMQELGFNFRLSDILCALGISQLMRIEQNLKRRREIAAVYRETLTSLSIETQQMSSDVKNAYHLYVIQTKDRKGLYNYLHEHKIYAQVHYIPVHKQPYYVERYGLQNLPLTDLYYEHTLSLPMYHSLSDEDLATTIKTVKNFFERGCSWTLRS